jgi:iron(III) transport system substrate-binding protein
MMCPMTASFSWQAMTLSVVLLLGAGPGCGPGMQRDTRVTLYTSLNEPTARAVISVFEERTGIRVDLRADTERDKTVGLVRTLIEERNRPRADVFWNSETANTIRLKNEGVLQPVVPPPAGAERIPATFRDPDGYWYGFAARARVLIVNTNLVGPDEFPDSVWDLINPRWRGQAAIVRPVTGTTLTHLAALGELLGQEALDRLLEGIQANDCHLPPGNGRLATLVGEGEIHFGVTDTSDYRLVRHLGKPVSAVYPDQGGIGTLLIPNTVSLVRGGPNPENGRRLLEFLISDEAEEILAHHQRGHIPLKAGIARPSDVRVPGEFEVMQVDFDQVGRVIERRLREFDARFP